MGIASQKIGRQPDRFGEFVGPGGRIGQMIEPAHEIGDSINTVR